MNRSIRTIGFSALISLILLLPFVILEAINHTITSKNALGVVLLFGLLWLLATAFISLLVPVIRAMHAGHALSAAPTSLVVRAVFLGFIALMWGAIFVDQLPCFLGVPNCD
jgi:hypothetical protein